MYQIHRVVVFNVVLVFELVEVRTSKPRRHAGKGYLIERDSCRYEIGTITTRDSRWTQVVDCVAIIFYQFLVWRDRINGYLQVSWMLSADMNATS